MLEYKVDRIEDIIKVNLPNLYICGEQGTGKTLITKCLTNNIKEYKSVKVSEPLYRICSLIRNGRYDKVSDVFTELGFDKQTTENMRGEITEDILDDIVENKKPRLALQKLGDIIRKYNEDALIRRAIELSRTQSVIIEDVRLEKEGEFFKENGFIGIRLISDEKNREKRLINRDGAYNKNAKNHKTENGINKIPYDYQIENNDESVDSLYNNILLALLKHL